MKKFTVKSQMNLKDFTDCTYPQGSFYFRALLKRGDIRINGKKVKSNAPLNIGDEVAYYTSKAEEDKPSHTKVYEDENIFIADKFSGVTSEALFCEMEPFIPIHRLDRNTCGLIAFAKNEQSAEELKEAFRKRKVKKIYLCIAKNNFKERENRLVGFLIKDEKNSAVSVYGKKVGGSEQIITDYKVLKDMGDIAEVEVELHTGRTHQIRAHLAFIGCPVLGDEKYGDGALNAVYSARRQILVAKRLSFEFSGPLAYLNGKVFESEFELVVPAKR